MANNYTLRYLESTEYDLWDEFVEKHPNGQVFQTSKYLQPISNAIGREFKIAGVYKGDRLLGGFAFSFAKKLGLKIIAAPYECPVFQPLFIDRETQYLSKQESYYSSVVNVLASFLKEKFDSVEFNFDFNKTDFRPYEKLSYKIHLRYTYLLNLKEYDDTNITFDPSIKRQIKKAEKNNYSISTGIEDNNIEMFFSLLAQTYHRQGLKIRYNKETYKTLFSRLRENRHFELYVLEFGKKPASVMGITMFNGVAHYWLSASNPELYSFGGTSALMAEVLKDLKRNKKINSFDFVGANTESIARFKSGFNFELTPVYNVRYEKRIVSVLLNAKNYLKSILPL